LGPLGSAGYFVRRSGVRWLREDGAFCRAGEPIAFCYFGLIPTEAGGREPFPEEWQDVQAVLAPRVAGRIRRTESSRGGFIDVLDHFMVWGENDIIAELEPAEPGGPALPGDPASLQLFITAGRRQADLSEGRQGILTGWHDRARAWRVEDEGPIGTILGLGICEMTAVLRGEGGTFVDLFSQIGGPAQAVVMNEDPLVPAARLLIEQNRRTRDEMQAIADDLVAHFADAKASPAEWIFAGALLRALARKPLTDAYEVLSRAALGQTGPADAILLSTASDQPSLSRHKRLGYAVSLHGFRVARAGPVASAWMATAFEREPRSLDGIADDYRELITELPALSGRPHAELLIANVMSSGGDDETQSYEAFDHPMGDTLALIHAKDVNLMLEDVAREPGVSIVDVDAITAEMGGQRHLPDNVHASGALQAELRREILHLLRARGVPGFTPALPN
jgi:hypothetical protein